MSFLDTLENLRKKPESVRYRILIGSIIVLMSLIIISWLSWLKFGPSYTKKPEVSENIGPAPLEVLKKTFEAGAAEFKSLSASALSNIFKKEIYTNQ